LNLQQHIRHVAKTAFTAITGLAPNIQVEKSARPIVRLGSDYGAWSFCETPALQNSIIVSAGLGEDASFDVEFARRYNARVVLVDPTPRAVQHFRQMMARMGRDATSSYGGQQSPDAYDLSGLSAANFALVEKALWIKKESLRFYAPAKAAHVSHSIVNYQNAYRTDTNYINVEATTLDAIVSECNLASIPLLKLDIEGAEIEVIEDLMTKGIFPEQILVEYDELYNASMRSKQRAEHAHGLLYANGYKLVHAHHRDFSYIRGE
jgi:FkbM family methyltransferase